MIDKEQQSAIEKHYAASDAANAEDDEHDTAEAATCPKCAEFSRRIARAKAELEHSKQRGSTFFCGVVHLGILAPRIDAALKILSEP
jgi:hypothetical protein